VHLKITNNILSDVANLNRSAWVQMDYTIPTWIYGTITCNLQ
jgi:hypothetical protein